MKMNEELGADKKFTVVLEEGASPIRVDAYIADQLEGVSRSMVGSSMSSLLVNGKQAKKSRKVADGDIIEFSYKEERDHTLVPQDIPLHIVYEDSDVMVIDKRAGMVVHPGAGNWDGTVANALAYHLQEKQGEGTSGFRPGIVHRLDKDTSGILITAKNRAALDFLAAQFKSRTTEKSYIALVKGLLFPRSGSIEKRMVRDPKNRKRFTITEDPALGRDAVTGFQVLRHFSVGKKGGYTLVKLFPKTGRTHQLRVHMLAAGAPILGDPLYSRTDARFPDAELMLHALSLHIVVPKEQEARTFISPMPERFKTIIKFLSQA